MSEILRAAFPGLQTTSFRVTSPADPLYNCIAWAAGSNVDWWWPLEDARKTHWPADVPRVLTLDAFVSAFLTLATRAKMKLPRPDSRRSHCCNSKGTPMHAASTDERQVDEQVGFVGRHRT